MKWSSGILFILRNEFCVPLEASHKIEALKICLHKLIGGRVGVMACVSVQQHEMPGDEMKMVKVNGL